MKRPLLLLLVLLALSSAKAQSTYPSAPIRMILSTSPGGGADATVRMIGTKLSERVGQPVVVENRPGASGMIAGAYVASQPADGYTLLVDITTITVNPSIYPKMSYSPLKDLIPVTQNIEAANVLVVNPSSPVKTLNEFIQFAKEKKGTLSYASAGNGSAQHLAMEVFKRQAGIELTHIPYKGGGPALVDVVAGHVDAYFGFLPAVAPYIKDGRLRALASTGSSRERTFPSLPTFLESGISNFTSYDWNGVFAPAKTPKPIVDRVQREIAAVLALPEIRSRLADWGTDPVGSTPDQFRTFLEQETAKWAKVVKEAHITVE